MYISKFTHFNLDLNRGIWALFKFFSVLFAAGAVAFGAGSASAQTKGDWVLGNYKGAGYWFPGVVEKLAGDKITIRYDDGDRETVSINAVRPYDWMIGTKVECNYKGGGSWYSGRIASLAGEKIGIAYDDGDKETTKTGRCRTK
ncbi:tudor domain-containing protein [Agrobacterium rosae]|uniref:tudor domain-containing protein n=1 Tax=Agrobacterium rosae TaxID=1972867 RepID=UPI003BA20147